MGRWAELARELERLLRLRTFPIALKLLMSEEEMDSIPRLRRFDHPTTFCQVLSLARTAGWTIGITTRDMEDVCVFPAVAGLAPPTEQDLTLAERVGYWLKTPEDGKKQGQTMYRIPVNGQKAIAVAPLAGEKFEPDMVLVYGNPAQLMTLSCGYLWTDYERLEFSFCGETACSDSIARCYVTGKPALTLPCLGERRMGCVQDDEIVIALPSKTVSKTVEGLAALSAVGIRYPTPFYGAEVDVSPNIRKVYGKKLRQWSKEQKSPGS